MKSWTRTLNIDDAHTLMAIAAPALERAQWVEACHAALPALSLARRREVIRLLRDGFLLWDDTRMVSGGFLDAYADAPATAQLDLMLVQWALTHPLPLVVAEQLVRPALERGQAHIPLDDLDDLVRDRLDTGSRESIRKTRTTVIGALEGVGALSSRGTGQHRSLHPERGMPHPAAFAWLVRCDLVGRGAATMSRAEAIGSSLGSRLTCCAPHHAQTCLDAAVEAGLLSTRGDEITAG